MPMISTIVPKGRFRYGADDSAAAAERKRIAEMLRTGQPVNINTTGTMHMPHPDGMQARSNSNNVVDGEVELVVPTGKLA